jgi:hypothetical protein
MAALMAMTREALRVDETLEETDAGQIGIAGDHGTGPVCSRRLATVFG